MHRIGMMPARSVGGHGACRVAGGSPASCVPAGACFPEAGPGRGFAAGTVEHQAGQGRLRVPSCRPDVTAAARGCRG
jgi:hypothetical protein